MRARIAALGATAQASVPGVYAWSVTVAPAAFAHGAPLLAQMAAALGIGSLAVAPILEGSRSNVARAVSVWGLVLTSLTVWTVVPSAAVSPLRTDLVRGLAGMLGWALFAFASAAPTLASPAAAAAPMQVLSRGVRPRGRPDRSDAVILWTGFVLACVFQGVGWRVAEPERAILVRLIGLAAGLATVNAASSIASSRRAPRTFGAPGRRARRALLPLVAFGLLIAGGAVVAVATER